MFDFCASSSQVFRRQKDKRIASGGSVSAGAAYRGEGTASREGQEAGKQELVSVTVPRHASYTTIPGAGTRQSNSQPQGAWQEAMSQSHG